MAIMFNVRLCNVYTVVHALILSSVTHTRAHIHSHAHIHTNIHLFVCMYAHVHGWVQPHTLLNVFNACTEVWNLPVKHNFHIPLVYGSVNESVKCTLVMDTGKGNTLNNH